MTATFSERRSEPRDFDRALARILLAVAERMARQEATKKAA